MEPIFPNIYRSATDNPSRDEKLYTYLIVRNDGNLLLPCKSDAVSQLLSDIEELGGVAAQFATHNHDVDGPFAEAVYDRFGAPLYYHHAERDAVAEITKCPSVEFGDDGLRLGSDFQALYFPSCCAGSSLYYWRDGESGFLFTSHVINRVEGDWQVGLDLWQYENLRDWGENKTPPNPEPQLSRIAQLPIDYTLPNVCQYGREEFHRFNDETKKSFATAMETKLEEEAGNLQVKSQ